MRPAEACVWCGAPFGPDADRMAGRTGCPSCGAATTDPWPDEAELEAAYGGWYRPVGGRRFNFAGDAILSRSRALLASHLDEIAPPGPILDVGAGDGTLLDALVARGREVVGLERGSKREDFRDEEIEEIEGGWAAVVFWHSLEHLPRPGGAIEAAARLLEPGGVVVVAVPNTASLQARAFGDRWLHLDLPRHLVHLSTESLTEGLARSGFRIEAVSYVRAGQVIIGWLAGLVAVLPGDLDLYQALRRPEARNDRLSAPRRALSLLAGIALLPFAAVAGALEVLMRKGGTVYVEGRIA